MLTTHALAEGDSLRIGTLTTQRRRADSMRPYLALSAWNPTRRDFDLYSWPDPPFALDGVISPDERTDQPDGRRTFLGLDPTRTAEHRRLIAGFQARLRRWKSEQAFRSEAVTRRKIDRQHRRQWPDSAKTA